MPRRGPCLVSSLYNIGLLFTMTRRCKDSNLCKAARYEMRNNWRAAEWRGAARSQVDCDDSWKWRHETVAAQLSLSLRLLVTRSHKAARKCSALPSMTGRCFTHPGWVIMKVEPEHMGITSWTRRSSSSALKQQEKRLQLIPCSAPSPAATIYSIAALQSWSVDFVVAIVLTLPQHDTHLSDCNFLTRLLYRHCC